jgi:hypothetical protein
VDRPAPAYRTYHHVAAIAFTGVCAWFVFRVGTRPPGLTYMDIAVHEIGHTMFRPFGELTMLVMGSGTQILFPLALAASALGYRRDLLAGAVFLAWAGEAVGDTAIYIADAPRGELPLLGAGGEGDWTRILGPEHLSRMHLAEEYARNLRILGAVLMLCAAGLCVYGLWRLHQPAGRTTPPNPAVPSAEEMWRGSHA